jgi:hypothetical protein
MAGTVTADLEAAHDVVVADIAAIPDAALDWRPGGEEWPIRQILGHLVHANDFYVMIVDAARAAEFGEVELHPGLPGWRRMQDTDAAVAACADVPAVLDCFERTFGRLLALLRGLTPEELDRPFVLRSPQPTVTTTLRERVVRTAAEHLREHQAHLEETLTRWREAEVTR